MMASRQHSVGCHGACHYTVEAAVTLHVLGSTSLFSGSSAVTAVIFHSHLTVPQSLSQSHGNVQYLNVRGRICTHSQLPPITKLALSWCQKGGLLLQGVTHSSSESSCELQGALTTYFQWRFQLQQDWLAEENLSGFETQVSNFFLGQVDRLDCTGTTHYNIIMIINTESVCFSSRDNE